jgi:hypothetical protein
MRFLIDNKYKEIAILRSSTMYNITEGREWGKIYANNEVCLKVLAEDASENRVSEVYRTRVRLNGKWHPWVSYTLDFKTPIDTYIFIYGGFLKNMSQVNNFIYKGRPVNSSGAVGDLRGLSDVERVLPRVPELVLSRSPCDIDNVIYWANKPYGLCIDYANHPITPAMVRSL